MTTSQAYTIARDAIQAQIKTLNVEANLHDLHGADHPGATRASKKRAELREALAIINLLLATERNR